MWCVTPVSNTHISLGECRRDLLPESRRLNLNIVLRRPTTIVLLLLVAVLVTKSAHSNPPAGIWFVKAGAEGDGRSFASPIGSSIVLERVSSAGDTIFLLASDSRLEGGLALKAGQNLIGLTDAGHKPVITNSDLNRNAGRGIVLAINNSVSNVRIEDTFASGIYGFNISSIRIDGVDVHGANRSKSSIAASYPTLPGSLPHGGMVFVHSKSPAEILVASSLITNAAGFGIVSVTSDSARSSLTVSHTQVEGGSRIGFFDAGIAALVRGSAARVRLEIFDSQIWGRLSQSGRNVMVVASGGANAVARVERSLSGATGQDGIVAAVMQSPSEINLYVHDSIIEDAGQMNIEGTLVNLKPADPSRANEGRVTIEIEGSTICNAGEISGFEDVAANVWIGGSQFPGNRMPAVGTYNVQITDSIIEGAGRSGLEFGDLFLLKEGRPEESQYEVVLRGNTIVNNGDAEVMIYAPRARVDARGNCWGRPEGLAEHGLKILAPVVASQFDAKEPVSCGEDSSEPLN